MPHYLKEWIFPATLFVIGFCIPIDPEDFEGPGLVVAKFFIGIGLGLAGFFFQTLFNFTVMSLVKGRLGFLKGEKKHLSVILMLAAKVVKADGKVDPTELKLIKQRLTQEFKAEDAARYLREFETYLDAKISIRELGKIIHQDFDQSSKSHLMYLLISLATADGLLSDVELDTIQEIAKFGRISPGTYLHVFKTFEFKREQTFRQKSQQSSGQRKSTLSASALRAAYNLIGISADAAMDDIKSAYRELAKIHHPDKVAHLGGFHQTKATEKFQLIVEAYDLIKEKRGV